MVIWPLEHPKNALFSKIAPKQIYFWPYSIKGSWLEYQKPHVEDGHWPLAWRQKWRAVDGHWPLAWRQKWRAFTLECGKKRNQTWNGRRGQKGRSWIWRDWRCKNQQSCFASEVELQIQKLHRSNMHLQHWDASMMADVPTFLFATRGQTHTKKLAKIHTHYITNKHVACAASTAEN